MRFAKTQWCDFAPRINRIEVLLILIEVDPPNAFLEVEHYAKAFDWRVRVCVNLDRGLSAPSINENGQKQAHFVAVPGSTPIRRALNCLFSGKQRAHQGPDIPRHGGQVAQFPHLRHDFGHATYRDPHKKCPALRSPSAR